MIVNDSRIRNGSGYIDPTMSAAFENIREEDAHVFEFIRHLKQEIRANGYELLERIAIRDTRTGREYR